MQVRSLRAEEYAKWHDLLEAAFEAKVSRMLGPSCCAQLLAQMAAGSSPTQC